MRIVGIEEHVNRPSAMKHMTWLPDALRAKLLPSVDQRIADMDAAGISVQVLSAPITAPGSDGAAKLIRPLRLVTRVVLTLVAMNGQPGP